MNWKFSTRAAKSSRRTLWAWAPFGCAVLCVAALVPWAVRAASAENGFDSVVGAIEQEYHVHATRIPFMGLAGFVAGSATHGGVRGIRVAHFEHFTRPADGQDPNRMEDLNRIEELNRIVEEKLGQGWSRMIRDTSRHGSEQTLIFARGESSRTGLFVLDLNANELDVVEVSVDPRRLKETIGRYRHRDGDGQQSN